MFTERSTFLKGHEHKSVAGVNAVRMAWSWWISRGNPTTDAEFEELVVANGFDPSRLSDPWAKQEIAFALIDTVYEDMWAWCVRAYRRQRGLVPAAPTSEWVTENELVEIGFLRQHIELVLGPPAVTVAVDGLSQRAWPWDAVMRTQVAGVHGMVQMRARELHEQHPEFDYGAIAGEVLAHHLETNSEFAGLKGLSWAGLSRLALQDVS